MISGQRLALEVGQELEEVELPPTNRLTLIRYAGASGDYNPIHTIDEEALKVGLQGVIQHGMLTMAQMGALFSPYLETGFIEHFHTRFVGMLFLGDVLRLRARVTSIDEQEGRTRYGLDIFARTSEGRSVARGSVRLVLFTED